MRTTKNRNGQRGATLVEFSIAATVFLMAMFAVIEFGRALWTHNALADAARRGARYAVVNQASKIDEVKNVVVYGNPAGGTTPIVENLSTTNVQVSYPGFTLD
ncbi:MAG: pilus assembly protein, partial [Acidobacteria bacterium]|nr:pilus assembly protein [Acidobacteriota bacterium]